MRTTVLLTMLVVLLPAPAARADRTTEERAASLRAQLARSPLDLQTRLRLVDLFLRAERAEEALAELELLEALAPGRPESVAPRARALELLGRSEEALAVLEQHLAHDGPEEELWLRARLLEGLGRLEQALADLDALAWRAPTLERDHARGRVLERLGRLDEAALAYEEGLARASGAATLRRALIEVERARGRPERGLVHADALIASARVAPRFRVLRAELLGQAGRAAEAEAELVVALADAQRLVARRGSPLALMERGRVWLAMGRRPEAIHDLEQALRRAPRLAEAHRLLIEARGGAR